MEKNKEKITFFAKLNASKQISHLLLKEKKTRNSENSLDHFNSIINMIHH